MMSVTSVLREYKRGECMGKGFQVLSLREYGSLHMIVGYLSVYWHQVFQENSINYRSSTELTVFPSCELLIGWSLVFNIFIWLSDHQECVPNLMHRGVLDSKDHHALLVLTERCKG